MVEVGGVGVVVDAVAVVEIELLGDAGGAVPLDEFEFDPNAIGVAADGASATVCVGWFGCGHGESGKIG